MARISVAVDIGERLSVESTILKPPSRASTFHGGGNRRIGRSFSGSFRLLPSPVRSLGWAAREQPSSVT